MPPGFDAASFVASLPAVLYVTFDVDGLDPSVVPATGTPEPGGLGLVDGARDPPRGVRAAHRRGHGRGGARPGPGSRASDFAAARLVAKMLSYQALADEARPVDRDGRTAPRCASRPLVAGVVVTLAGPAFPATSLLPSDFRPVAAEGTARAAWVNPSGIGSAPGSRSWWRWGVEQRRRGLRHGRARGRCPVAASTGRTAYAFRRELDDVEGVPDWIADRRQPGRAAERDDLRFGDRVARRRGTELRRHGQRGGSAPVGVARDDRAGGRVRVGRGRTRRFAPLAGRSGVPAAGGTAYFSWDYRPTRGGRRVAPLVRGRLDRGNKFLLTAARNDRGEWSARVGIRLRNARCLGALREDPDGERDWRARRSTSSPRPSRADHVALVRRRSVKGTAQTRFAGHSRPIAARIDRATLSLVLGDFRDSCRRDRVRLLGTQLRPRGPQPAGLRADRRRGHARRGAARRCRHVPGTGCYRTVEELLEAGVDAVVVATPASTHYEIGKKLLQAGIDVLIEKPLALSVAHGRGAGRARRSRSDAFSWWGTCWSTTRPCCSSARWFARATSVVSTTCTRRA